MIVIAMGLGLVGTYFYVGDRRGVAWQNVESTFNAFSRTINAPWYEEPPPPPQNSSWMEQLARGIMNRSVSQWAESAEQYETHPESDETVVAPDASSEREFDASIPVDANAIPN